MLDVYLPRHLQSSEKYYEAKYHLAEHGVKADTVTLDLEAMLGRKDDVVEGLNQGVSLLLGRIKSKKFMAQLVC